MEARRCRAVFLVFKLFHPHASALGRFSSSHSLPFPTARLAAELAQPSGTISPVFLLAQPTPPFSPRTILTPRALESPPLQNARVALISPSSAPCSRTTVATPRIGATIRFPAVRAAIAVVRAVDTLAHRRFVAEFSRSEHYLAFPCLPAFIAARICACCRILAGAAARKDSGENPACGCAKSWNSPFVPPLGHLVIRGADPSNSLAAVFNLTKCLPAARLPRCRQSVLSFSRYGRGLAAEDSWCSIGARELGLS